MITKKEEMVLHSVQKNGTLENFNELSVNEINVVVEDLITKGFVVGKKTEQGGYMKGSVRLDNRGKLHLEQLSNK